MSAAKMKHIPALRFPEFTEPWKTGSIDSCVKRYNHPVAVEPDCMYRQIGVRSHGKGIFHKAPVTGKSLGDKRVFWVHPQAFVVNIVFGWEQAVALTSAAEDGFIASHRFPMFVPNESKTDLNFLLLFFLRKKGKYLLELASPGGAGRNKTLGQNEFAKLDVTLPTLPEQQKIATFVGAVDKKLEALRRKHELLQTYKRGIMQKIFLRELRFKADDGSEFPIWEKKLFGELFRFVRTNNLSRDQLSDHPQQIQNIHYGDIHTKYRSQFFLNREVVPYVQCSFKWDISEEEYCCPGDLIIADASEDYADIGKAIEVMNANERSLVAGLHTFIARPKNNDFVLGFAGYIMQSIGMRRQVMKIAQGISVLGISKPNLSKLTLWKPHHDEQKKIADFLSAIDAKIDAVAEQIGKMKQFKKGLLQQMFV